MDVVSTQSTVSFVTMTTVPKSQATRRNFSACLSTRFRARRVSSSMSKPSCSFLFLIPVAFLL